MSILDKAKQVFSENFDNFHCAPWYADRSFDISVNTYLTPGKIPMDRYILTVGLVTPDSEDGYVYLSLSETRCFIEDSVERPICFPASSKP